MEELLLKAVEAEEQKNLFNAIEYYQRYINSCNDPCLDAFINLLCIYFETQDPGTAIEYGLDNQFVDKCYTEMNLLIAKAKRLYSDSIQLKFWINYIKYFCYGEHPYESLNEDDYTKQLITLDPYFAFFSKEHPKFRNQAKKLFSEVASGKTFRERLIKSILEKSIS